MKDYKDYIPNCYDLYGEFRDKYDKYKVGGDGYWLDDKQNGRRVDSVRKEYVKIIEIINEKTGFNTGAPVIFYEQARKLSEKLAGAIDEAKFAENNKELLRRADWALFDKHDFLKAKKLLNKIRIR